MSFGFPNKSHTINFLFFKDLHHTSHHLTPCNFLIFCPFFRHRMRFQMVYHITRFDVFEGVEHRIIVDLCPIKKNLLLNFFIFFLDVVRGMDKLQYKFYYGTPLGLGDIYF